MFTHRNGPLYFLDFGPGRIVALIFCPCATSASLQIRHSIPPTLMRFGSGITPSESQRSKVLFVTPMCLAASAVEWRAFIDRSIVLGIREIRGVVKLFLGRMGRSSTPGMIQDFGILKIGIPLVSDFGS